MSDFRAHIVGQVDLSKARSDIEAFLRQYENNPIDFKVNIQNINKANSIAKQFQNVGKQASTSFSKGFNVSKAPGIKGFVDYKKQVLKHTNDVQKEVSKLTNIKVPDRVIDEKSVIKWTDEIVDSQQKARKKAQAKIRQNNNAYYKEVFDNQFKDRHSKSDIQKQMSAFYKQQEVEQKALMQIQNRINSGEFELRNTKNDVFLSKYKNQDSDALKRVKEQIKDIKTLQSELKTGIYESGENKGLKITESDQITKVQQLDTAVNKLSNSMKEVSILSSKTLDDGIAERSADKLKAYYETNTKMHKKYGQQFKDLEDDYRRAVTEADKLNIDKKVNNLKDKVSAEGLTGKGAFDDFKRAFGQIAQFAGAYGMIQNVAFEVPRQIVQNVKDINSAQIELMKVSSAPQSQLTDYWDEATASAKKYGSTISDVIKSTADWSRLGYNLEDAKELSDVTTLLSKVGDNMTQESSSEGLISTLKGFELSADKAESIVDKVNEVANTQPIDTSGLFEGLKRSASSMNAANNSLEQTIALITAANSVVQDADVVGTTFKTISMRIRGAKTELEEAGLETDGMAKSTSSLREEILALSGVDIMIDDNTFKSTYDILDELSNKWQGLSDIQQASITELIAGKRNGNVVSSLLSNFDIARQTFDTAKNKSQGSAERELENWNKGIEASIAHFKAQFQELSTVALDSDIFKGFVDSGTALISVLTEIISIGGGVPAVLTGIAGTAFFKNLDKPKIIGFTI